LCFSISLQFYLPSQCGSLLLLADESGTSSLQSLDEISVSSLLMSLPVFEWFGDFLP
jgi:hypothetical protein